MPFTVDHAQLCPSCPFGVCVEDRRVNRVHGRSTQFRVKQHSAMACTFGEFIPGTDNDPQPERAFSDYLGRFRENINRAGAQLFQAEFGLQTSALAKVEGDVYELLEAGAIWNALTVWNSYMDTGVWNSNVFTQPANSIATPTRKVGILKLPRGYDTTLLFKPEIRNRILAFVHSLKLRDMELGLSAPDIVGIRIPHPTPPEFLPFLSPLPNLSEVSRGHLEGVYRQIEGTLDGSSFLFALAVKRTTRSDRLYQPLFEANVLKYLIENVLGGAAFRFYVHMESFAGAAVEEHYKAASLVSLVRGGEPQRAVNATVLALRPREAAQVILEELPLFPT